jgi:hypothetical protein
MISILLCDEIGSQVHLMVVGQKMGLNKMGLNKIDGSQ